MHLLIFYFNSRVEVGTSLSLLMADSRYRIVKDGWGNRSKFQASHGLGMTPEDLAEGDKIVDAMQSADTGTTKEKNAEEGK